MKLQATLATALAVLALTVSPAHADQRTETADYLPAIADLRPHGCGSSGMPQLNFGAVCFWVGAGESRVSLAIDDDRADVVAYAVTARRIWRGDSSDAPRPPEWSHELGHHCTNHGAVTLDLPVGTDVVSVVLTQPNAHDACGGGDEPWTGTVTASFG